MSRKVVFYVNMQRAYKGTQQDIVETEMDKHATEGGTNHPEQLSMAYEAGKES